MIGAIAGRSKWMDAFDGGMWSFGDSSCPETMITYFAGTFVRHPLALSAAHAGLTYMKEQGAALQEDLNRKAANLTSELAAFVDSVGAPIKMECFASLVRVNLPDDLPHTRMFYQLMRHRGFFILEDRNMFLIIAHTADHLRAFADAFKEVVSLLQAEGFMPSRETAGSVLTQQPDMVGA